MKNKIIIYIRFIENSLRLCTDNYYVNELVTILMK